jgi:fibronectin-binding autotransporter adhesin
VFPGFAESAAARFGASEGQLFGELAYPTTFGNLMLEPFGDFAWLHLATDSFAETGGIAALSGSGSTDDIGYVTLGARAATNYILRDNIVLTPRASLGWQHTFGEVVPTAALDFQSTGTSFGIAGVPLARDAALVEAGADVRLTPHATIGISYVGQHASSAQDNSAKGNFTWKF